VLAAVPLTLVIVFGYALTTGFHPFDFRMMWLSGHDVLNGRSPYPGALPHVAHEKTFRPFPYPAPAALVMAAFALLPYAVATVAWAAISLASIVGALYLLGIRDWRCYGVVALCPLTWGALGGGTISPELFLGCAALWRFRSRPYVAGPVLAALVVLKLYLWPLGLWLLVTRRFRASLVGAGVAAVVTLGGWAAIGFAGFREYPQLLDRLTKLVAAESYSPYAFARSLGASDGTARLVMLGLGALVLAAVVERGRRPARDSAAFVLAIAVSLVLTPIVWPHYLILGFVAVALARPRFGVPWVVPAIIGAVLPGWSHGHAFLIAPALVVFCGLFGWAAWRLSQPGAATSEAPRERRPRALPASPSAAPS
jgi:hypothetical protein